MRFHDLDEFLGQRSFPLEKIVQPGIVLLGRCGIEDDRTGREIPVENIVFVVAARAVSIQIKPAARWMIAQVLLQTSDGISTGVMDQVASDRGSPRSNCAKVTYSAAPSVVTFIAS